MLLFPDRIVEGPRSMSNRQKGHAKAAFEHGLSLPEYQAIILKRPASDRPAPLPDEQPHNPPKRPPGTVVLHPKPID
jgi:hypothetical protein